MENISKEVINKALGKVVKEYRLKNKLTQEEIAEKLEISAKYISRIENGSGGVKTETLVNYINLLGISPNVIFKDLINNKDLNLELELELSEKASKLSKENVQFIISVIDLLEKDKEDINK